MAIAQKHETAGWKIIDLKRRGVFSFQQAKQAILDLDKIQEPVGEGGTSALDIHYDYDPIETDYNMKGVSKTVFSARPLSELAIGHALGQLAAQRGQEDQGVMG